MNEGLKLIVGNIPFEAISCLDIHVQDSIARIELVAVVNIKKLEEQKKKNAPTTMPMIKITQIDNKLIHPAAGCIMKYAKVSYEMAIGMLHDRCIPVKVLTNPEMGVDLKADLRRIGVQCESDPIIQA